MTHPSFQVLQPPGWPRPSGYSNGLAAEGRLVFLAGQIGWNADGILDSDDLVEQTRQALSNVVAVLAEAGARPEHIVRLTWYVTDVDDYRARKREIGEAYRAVIGRHYPAMTLIQVAGLAEPRARVEIEATAVIPR